MARSWTFTAATTRKWPRELKDSNLRTWLHLKAYPSMRDHLPTQRQRPRSTRSWPTFAAKRSGTRLQKSAESERWQFFTSDTDRVSSAGLKLRILSLTAANLMVSRETA